MIHVRLSAFSGTAHHALAPANNMAYHKMRLFLLIHSLKLLIYLMSSFTFCDSLIPCVISLFALFILWRTRFFKPGAKIKNKFLDKQMSYGLKCEMIIKKLLSPNYPPFL